MVLSRVGRKIKRFVTQLRKEISETRATFKSINEFMRSIDVVMVRFAWVSAVFEGLSSLGTFAVFGVLLQKAGTDYFTKGSIPSEVVYMGVAAFSGYFFVSAVIGRLVHFRSSVFENKINYVLEEEALNKLLALDLGRLTDPRFIALRESSGRRGINAMRNLFGAQMRFIELLVGIVASVGVMVALDPPLIFLAFIPMIPRTIKAWFLEKKDRQLWEVNHANRRMKEEYGECLGGKRMLVQTRLFQFTERFRQRFDLYRQRLLDSDREVKWFDFKTDALVQIAEALVVIAALVFLTRKFVTKEIAFAKLFFFVGSIRTLASSLSRFSGMFVKVKADRRNYQYRTDFMTTKPLIDEAGAHPCFLAGSPELVFEDVSFAYPRQEQLALNGCSFTIASGEKVAVVGRNGSGKTTILRLLTKFFLPKSGDVTIDGISIVDILQSSWLEHVLCVTQENDIPDLTIQEAITGQDPEQISWDRLIRAAHISGADDFISHLPQGYATQIGPDWPGGQGFSSGQMQRIKLTAAFYRLLDPKVYVGFFDEPMAHCDPGVRENFYRSIRKMEGKTIVVIAHDPVYLHHFDRVIEIGEGCVVNDVRGLEAIEEYRAQLAMSLATDL